MNKINILSEDLINKISAGELIERPAYVVKELIENSIDAESNTITIDLVNSGKQKIVVSDNGTGISEHDLKLAILRHTTSKIANLEDLYSITSLGFRGEALASIASISKLSIQTKTKDSDYGLELKSTFGDIVSINKCTCKDGTNILVDDFFQNTPARLKFLKSDQTEFSHSLNFFNNFALAYPNISFKLINNGKTFLYYPANNEITERFNLVFNSKAKWLSAQSEHNYLSAELYILDPKVSNKKDYRTFINGRIVNDKVMYHALNSSFEKYSSSSFNTAVLFLNCDPNFIDVNVSPTKSEVRFRESSLIHDFVTKLVEQIFSINKSSSNLVSLMSKNTFGNFKNDVFTKNYKESPKLFQDVLSSSYFPNKKILGQYKNQYLIYEEDEKLFFVDQHAAHERINFEKILKTLMKNTEIQNLLLPEFLELSKQDSLLFEKHLSELQGLGFDIEKEENNFVVRSVPKIFSELDIVKLFFELIKNYDDKISIVNNLSLIAAPLSCHASIRGATVLNEDQIASLLDELELCEYPYTCPHGRPIKLEFTLDDIEKLFKRK